MNNIEKIIEYNRNTLNSVDNWIERDVWHNSI